MFAGRATGMVTQPPRFARNPWAPAIPMWLRTKASMAASTSVVSS